MTATQPEAMAAFLASAEYAILQAPQGSDEDASEALIAAGCRYAPRLLAAVEAVMDLADGWDNLSSPPSAVPALHATLLRTRAFELREAISGALLGEGERGDVSATHESESAS